MQPERCHVEGKPYVGGVAFDRFYSMLEFAMRSMCMRVAVVLVGALLAGRAAAATYDWSNGAGGAFATATNWSPAGVPTSIDTARLSLDSTYTITFSNLATVNTLVQTLGDVTFDLNSATFRTTNTSSNILGAAGVTTTLRVTDGSFRPSNLILANVANSTSNLVLDTDSGTVVGTGTFYVGSIGTGNLTVQNGATLSTSSGAALAVNTNSIGNATVTGFGSNWTIGTAALRVGSLGNGALNITNGANVAAAGLEVGEFLNSTGTMSLSGLDAMFTTAGTANIGGTSATQTAASATLNIEGGAVVNFSGTTNFRTRATVNLDGGVLNLSTVNVTNGAKFNWSSGTVNFANGSAVTNNLLDFLLTGSHTLGSNRTLSATAGTMTLNTTLALNSGRIASEIVMVNQNLNFTGFSSMTASQSIFISPGVTVELNDFSRLATASGLQLFGGILALNGSFAKVDGPVTNTSGVITGVGRFTGGISNTTSGILRVESGDHLIIDGASNSNSGTIELSEGTVEYTQALANAATGVISGRGVFRGSSATPGGTGLNNVGTLAFSAGTTDIFGDVNNSATGKIIAAGASVVTFFDDVIHNGVEIRTNAGSRSVFFGSVSGAGPFTGTGDVEFNGDIKPGNSPANVSFGGNVTIGPTAGLDIELAGPTKGSGYDSLTISGAAALSGALDVVLLDDFAPSAGQAFEILKATGGIDGAFSAQHLPALSGGLHLDLVYGANAVNLFVGGVAGDYNLDGTVDSADFIAWRKEQGRTGSALAADGNHDGAVDSGDYEVWRANFGKTAASGVAFATAAAAPEPGLLITAFCAIALASAARPNRPREAQAAA